MVKKVLFGISSLGLGHATRELPIIEHYLKKGWKVYILSNGGALKYLKKEFGNKVEEYYFSEDIPRLERGKGANFYYSLLTDTLIVEKKIKKENKLVEKLVEKEKFDLIISDPRYGCYSLNVPSLLVTHQISLVMPKFLGAFQRLADSFNYNHFKNFDCVLIPDYSGRENLAGDLSHTKILKKFKHEYIGILSSYKKLNIKQDIDYYFVISGYLHEHKESFVNRLIEQSKELKGKKIFVLGDISKNYHKIDKKNNIEVYAHAFGKLRNELMNRAKVVISRAGYTTVMDLVELDKKALLIPTPGQTEQEYLGEYLNNKGLFVTYPSQKDFDLKKLLKKIDKTKKFGIRLKTKDTLRKIEGIIR